MVKFVEFVALGSFLFGVDIHRVTSYSPSELNYNTARHRRQNEENIKCKLPEYPENGFWKLIPTGSAQPGDIVTENYVIQFKCNPGYKLNTNTNIAVCTENWKSAKFPECEKPCPPLHSSDTFQLTCYDKNGMNTSCASATHGTYLEYTCARYYEIPSGSKRSLSCEKGKWSQEKPVCLPICGRTVPEKSVMFLVRANVNEEFKYPWIAILYKLEDDGTYEHICGGSILSQTVIVTAAHCVTDNNGDAMLRNKFLIGAGKLRRKYQALEDTSAQYLNVSKIFVHEKYKTDRLISDIAVLITKGELVLSEVVQPVCFYGLRDIELRPNNVGEVSGWGYTEENVPSEVLRTLEIPYKTPDICARELSEDINFRYNTVDKICAGFYNKSKGVCNGDSGSGLTFKNTGGDNRYYIHGIVSSGDLVNTKCNAQQNALFIKVAAYYEFIDKLLIIYAPKIRDCVLPPYPQNGKWTIDNYEKKPGEAVPSSTVLNIECNSGYNISSTEMGIECRAAENMPTCEKLCEPLNLPKGTSLKCVNKKRQSIDCVGVTEGTKLWYTCPKEYFLSYGSTNESICKDGSWAPSTPECDNYFDSCGKEEKNVFYNYHSSFFDGPRQKYMEYSWSVSIYTDDVNPTYVCGGSYLRYGVVLTSAACVTNENGEISPRRKYLVVGGDNNPKSEFLRVIQIIVHPRYYIPINSHYGGNIAVLILAGGLSVLSVCVSGINYIDLPPNITGIIPGWSIQDNITYEVYQVVPSKIEECVMEERRNYEYYEDRRCVTFVNATNCLGNDMGKGLYWQNPEDGKYYIYGIVSEDNFDTECKRSFLYTSIQYYYDFVVNVLLSSLSS